MPHASIRLKFMVALAHPLKTLALHTTKWQHMGVPLTRHLGWSNQPSSLGWCSSSRHVEECQMVDGCPVPETVATSARSHRWWTQSAGACGPTLPAHQTVGRCPSKAHRQTQQPQNKHEQGTLPTHHHANTCTTKQRCAYTHARTTNTRHTYQYQQIGRSSCV